MYSEIMKKGNKLIVHLVIFVILIYVLIATAVYYPYFEDEINAVFTGIMVIITAIYMIFTGRILEESEKNRKIVHLEKKLENLYFPLKDVLEHFMYIYCNYGYEEEAHLIPDDEDPEVKRNDEYISLIKPILIYQHLAEDNIRDDLDSFFKTVNGQKVYTERGLLQFAVALNEKVREDIISLQIFYFSSISPLDKI